MRTFHLANFGCRASFADGAALKAQLLAAGLEESAAPAASDVAVLNTCTVTATADAEVRQVIRRIHRENPECRILVTGCYAQRAPAELAALDGVAWVVGNSHKHRVAEVLGPGRREGEAAADREDGGAGSEGFSAPAAGRSIARGTRASPPAERGAGVLMVGDISPEFHFAPVFAGKRTRPTLKVQDGCSARCAFCIIPDVRGPSRSLAPDRVLAEVQSLDRQGYREVVLSGINLGSYGRDLGRTIDFLGLLDRILNETAIARVRISSIEPMDVSPALIRLAARESRVADHFHVPLQSGSDRILRLMNRRYWAKQYAERILAIREMLPNAGVGADVMTGFPGETPQDHAASLDLIERLPFTYLHVFPYSPRPGTAAAAAAGQVPSSVAHERGRELRAEIARKRQEFLEAQMGRRLSVVTLDRDDTAAPGASPRRALSSNYLPVELDVPNLPANELLEVEVGRVSPGLLHAYPAGGR